MSDIIINEMNSNHAEALYTMAQAPKILAFSGSARRGSVNKKFITVGARAAEAAGAKVTLVDMADYGAPLFNGDLEEASGLPETMKHLKSMMLRHDGFLISSPEYNGFFPALIKNTFDWCTRAESQGEDGMAGTTGKFVGLMAASPGGLGGVRCIPRLRDCLAEYGITAVSGFATLPGAFQAFNDDGTLNNEKAQATVDGLVGRLVTALRRA
jgi:chromate reductase, NAD(P)H dehydrogenase (quinone)